MSSLEYIRISTGQRRLCRFQGGYCWGGRRSVM